MADEDKWVLSQIKIGAFLGVGKSGITIDMDRPVIILHGPSGSGKSTIVSAIEWGLFGSTERVPDYSVTGVGDNVPTHRSFIHDGENGAEVTLRFEKGRSTLIWRRFRNKVTPKPSDDELSCLIDGAETPADTKTIFGLTQAIYTRGVAPKQTTIRNLVHYEKADRNEVLDYLFGIESLNSLSVGLSRGRQNIQERVNKLSDRYQLLSGRLRDPVKDQFDKRAQARQSAIDSGASRDHLTLAVVVAVVQETSAILGEQPPPADISLEELQGVVTTLREQAERAWARPGPQEKVRRLTDVNNKVPNAWSNWQQSVDAVRVTDQNLKKLVDEVGDKKTVADRVSETTKSLEAAISSLGDANSQAAVLEQAKTWFTEHDHGPDLACPVCQRGIEPSVLSSSIDTSLQTLRGSDGAIAKLEDEIQQARVADNLAVRSAESLAVATAKAKSLASAALHQISVVLNVISSIATTWGAVQQLDPNETAVYEIMQTVSNISPDAEDAGARLEPSIRNLISVVDKAYTESSKELGEASEQADKVKTRIVDTQRVLAFLKEDKILSKMDVLLSDSNMAIVAAGIAEARKIEATVQALAEAAGVISETEASKIAVSISGPISEWFGRISQHDVLKAAEVTTNITRMGGLIRNKYEIRATDAAGANPVSAGHNLSGGYEMVLAVSALCAIQQVVSSVHNVGLFVLDEPTESLDPELAKEMGKSLGLNVPGARTIITTNRLAFATEIRDSAGPARAKLVDLNRWTVSKGTSIRNEDG